MGDVTEETVTEETPETTAEETAEETTTTEETQGSDDAGTEGSDTAPDTYADFDLPEGSTLDEAALTDVSPLLKEMGLDQEQAQKLVDFYAGSVQASSQKQVDDFSQMLTEWRTQSENDKEFGGDNFEQNVAVAQNAIDKYGTPELKQLLSDHGVGSHPEMVRFMVRVGKTLSEDKPGEAGNNPSKTKDHAERLYG